MAVTLEELEKRVGALEQEVARLKQSGNGLVQETGPKRRAHVLDAYKMNQESLSAAVAKAYAEMGIVGQPIGAEKLQALLLASGIKPEENALSRGIIEMREE